MEHTTIQTRQYESMQGLAATDRCEAKGTQDLCHECVRLVLDQCRYRTENELETTIQLGESNEQPINQQ